MPPRNARGGPQSPSEDRPDTTDTAAAKQQEPSVTLQAGTDVGQPDEYAQRQHADAGAA